MNIYLLIVGSYLIGSVPFGYILTKFFLNKDIRKIGSGNIGATNVLRTGNKIIGYATLLLDVLKAVLPIIFIKINYPEYVFISALNFSNVWMDLNLLGSISSQTTGPKYLMEFSPLFTELTLGLRNDLSLLVL